MGGGGKRSGRGEKRGVGGQRWRNEKKKRRAITRSDFQVRSYSTRYAYKTSPHAGYDDLNFSDAPVVLKSSLDGSTSAEEPINEGAVLLPDVFSRLGPECVHLLLQLRDISTETCYLCQWGGERNTCRCCLQ